MKRPYFQKKTGVNSDLATLTSFFNLTEYEGTNWFIKDINNVAYVASVVGLTGSTVTAGANRSSDPGAGYVFRSAIARTFGENIYLFASYYNSSVTTTKWRQFRSTDGGTTWITPVTGQVSSVNNSEVIDIFKLGSTVYYVISYGEATKTSVIIYIYGGGTTVGNISFNTADYEQHAVSGYGDGTTYYFLVDNPNQDATYISKYKFTVANNIEYVESSGITVASITTWDVYTQIYFLKGDTEVFMNQDTLKSRFKSGSWASYFVPIGTSVNGIIRDHDYLGNPVISFNLWGNAIWEITDKGVLKKNQALEPRDYKKVYLTNTNESLAGVVQFQNANGNDDLSDWTDASVPDCCEVSIVDEVDGHENVMKLDDQSAVDFIIYTLSFSSAQTSGLISLGFRSTDTGKAQYIRVLDISNRKINIRFDSDKIGYFYAAGWHDATNGTVTDDTWYHVKIVFDCVADTYDFYLNGILLDADIPFENVGINATRFSFGSGSADSGYQFYCDAIGFSWDGYVSGSNKKINAYVGYGSEIGEAWFSTGNADTSIMQLSFKDYTKGTKKSLVVSEMYQAPKHTLIRITKPFEDEWVKEYTNAEVLFYEGKVKDNDNDGRFFYKYLMNSWEDEYKTTKITVSLLAYTHGTMLKYILDNYSKYLWYGPGTNANVNEFTADQISGADDDWTNSTSGGGEEEYVAKKAFLNGFLYHCLELTDDATAANFARIININITGKTVFSGKFVTNDATKPAFIRFYEDATQIGFLGLSTSITWFDGASQIILTPTVSNTIYHWTVVFDASADTVDCYIDGLFKSTETLGNNITTEITSIRFTNTSAEANYITYHAQFYKGNSLVDAMHTYCSISPLLTDAYDFNFKTYTHPAIQKLIAEETGYIVSVRPSGQVYLDQYAPSGVLINKNAPQGITYLTLMKIRNEKFSQITFYGGYVGGKPIIAEGFAEPNFGSYEDWFPTIDGSEVGDLYYDVDGNPKSLRLDAMVAKALSDRNIVIKKQTLGKRGVGPIYHGTSLTYNNNHYKITMETWNTWRKVTYNALRDDNRVEIADSYLSPTTADPEDDRDSQVDAAIGSNADNIVKVEQNVGAVEEKTTWSPRDYGLPDFDDDGAEGTALTDDVAWNDLDISAIVGAKTMRVIIHVLGLDNVINSAVFIRTKGHTGAGCRCVIRTGSAGQEATNEWEGHTNSVGVLQIQCMPKPTSWNQISLWIADYRRA